MRRRKQVEERKKTLQTRGFLGDAVEDIRLDEEARGSLGDIGTASLPVGSLGIEVLLNDMPLVLDFDIPRRVHQGANCGRDGVVGTGSGIGSQALAVGAEARRVLGCRRGDVEAVGTTAWRALELEVSRCPGGGLTVGQSTSQAQGGEDDGEESGELHDGGDGRYYRGSMEYRPWERVNDNGQLKWKEGRDRK